MDRPESFLEPRHMWNLYVCEEHGDPVKINIEPYSAAQVALALMEAAIQGAHLLLTPVNAAVTTTPEPVQLSGSSA